MTGFRRKFFPGSRGAGVRSSRVFKKKQFAWQYVELEETALARTDGATTDVILFNSADWTTNANAENVKNVSLDLRIMYAWSPNVTTVAYDTWYLKGAIFVLDADEVGGTIDGTFAAHRALWWNAQGMNTGEQPTANGASPDHRAMHWRVKAKQRFMKYDEELRFLTAFNSIVNETLADARVSIFGRMSWETP